MVVRQGRQGPQSMPQVQPSSPKSQDPLPQQPPQSPGQVSHHSSESQVPLPQ